MVVFAVESWKPPSLLSSECKWYEEHGAHLGRMDIDSSKWYLLAGKWDSVGYHLENGAVDYVVRKRHWSVTHGGVG